MAFFWQILLSYCKFIMPRPLKWGILGIGTIILYVWFEFLWIRLYVTKPHLFLWYVSVLNINPADEDLKRFIYSKWKNLLCFNGKISNEFIHQHSFFQYFTNINCNNFMQRFVRIRLKCFQVFFIMSIAKLSLTKPERKF